MGVEDAYLLRAGHFLASLLHPWCEIQEEDAKTHTRVIWDDWIRVNERRSCRLRLYASEDVARLVVEDKGKRVSC
jgi:hypothetical protein